MDTPISVLSFDFGLKQIGIAYGQTLTKCAKGIVILKAKDGIPNWDAVGDLINEWKPNLLLVGLPLNMDSSESELSARARKFARRIEGRFSADVQMVDERLTSQEAKMLVRENSNKDGSRLVDFTKVDHIAAALILQSWLDDHTLGSAL